MSFSHMHTCPSVIFSSLLSSPSPSCLSLAPPQIILFYVYVLILLFSILGVRVCEYFNQDYYWFCFCSDFWFLMAHYYLFFINSVVFST
jgi:hypothetical protein